MLSPKRKHEFATWQAPGSPLIVYSEAVMHEIAGEPAGTGGVLYGTCDEGEVRITAARPVPGIGEDAQALERASEDPSLAGLVPVGWYLWHTRGGIFLSEDDVRIWDRYFGEPWQVVLVLSPGQGQPTQAGFFFRPSGGRPQTESSHLVFEAGPAPEADPAAPPEEMLDVPGPRGGSPRGLWWIAAACAVVFTAAAAFLWWNSRYGSRPAPQISLRLVERGGQLRATWDATAPPVLQASGGLIEVVDGDTRITLPLSQALLRNGVWPIMRSSPEVQVRLELIPAEADPQAEPVQAIARFFGKPVARSEPQAPDSRLSELAQLEEELTAQSQANDQLEKKAEALRAQLTTRLAAPAPKPPPAPPAPAPAKPQPAAAPAATPGPAPAQSPAAPATGPGLFGERAGARPPPVALPPPAYTGPGSGKLIWTGFLPANGSLTIEGRRATSGNVTGALPGVAVQITAYPAEFSSNGLSVYSASARHARGNVVEPRSAQTGWLETRYIYDTRRARDVVVTEAPATANGFQRIQVRGGDRPLSVIVIDWEVDR